MKLTNLFDHNLFCVNRTAKAVWQGCVMLRHTCISKPGGVTGCREVPQQ